MRSNCKGQLMEARSIDACALWIEGRQWLVSHIRDCFRLRVFFVCPCKQCNQTCCPFLYLTAAEITRHDKHREPESHTVCTCCCCFAVGTAPRCTPHHIEINLGNALQQVAVAGPSDRHHRMINGSGALRQPADTQRSQMLVTCGRPWRGAWKGLAAAEAAPDGAAGPVALLAALYACANNHLTFCIAPRCAMTVMPMLQHPVLCKHI